MGSVALGGLGLIPRARCISTLLLGFSPTLFCVSSSLVRAPHLKQRMGRHLVSPFGAFIAQLLGGLGSIPGARPLPILLLRLEARLTPWPSNRVMQERLCFVDLSTCALGIVVVFHCSFCRETRVRFLERTYYSSSFDAVSRNSVENGLRSFVLPGASSAN